MPQNRGVRKNNEQTEEVYTTLDAYQSSFLTLRGFNPIFIKQSDRAVFAFSASEALYQAIAQYNSGAMVEAIRFASVAKYLESQIASTGNKIGLWDWD